MSYIFKHQVENVGDFALRPLDAVQDAELLHSWVSQPYARYWGMMEQSVEQVRDFYLDLLKHHPDGAFIGVYQGKPTFLLERYQAIHDPVGQCYPAQNSDYGMHILVAPADKPVRGFTWAVFQTIVAFMFSDERVARIVVEPDVRNEKIHRLNKRAGFVYQHQIELANKTAWLAFCDREQHAAALRHDTQFHSVSRQETHA